MAIDMSGAVVLGSDGHCLRCDTEWQGESKLIGVCPACSTSDAYIKAFNRFVEKRDTQMCGATVEMGEYSVGVNEQQIAGDHYKSNEVQTWDYIHRNGIGYLAGNIIKYVSRYQKKNGLEDLQKAKHYLEKLIEEEESNEG